MMRLGIKRNSVAALLFVAAALSLSACGDPDTAPPSSLSTQRTGPSTSDLDGAGRPAVSGTDIDDAIAKEWGANGANGGAGDRVFFETDKSTLEPQGRDQLTRWVAFLKKYPHENLLVQGHSDERGTREYNLALGERRAEAVKDFLMANGIDASRVETVSYGKERPEVVGSNESAYSQNRRAVGLLQ
jgi:peptidoglycan-associated lipoprotein